MLVRIIQKGTLIYSLYREDQAPASWMLFPIATSNMTMTTTRNDFSPQFSPLTSPYSDNGHFIWRWVSIGNGELSVETDLINSDMLISFAIEFSS